MPNWCHNKLKVSGRREQMTAFAEQVKTDEQPLSFAGIVPPPEGLFEREAFSGSGPLASGQAIPEEKMGWYEWCCEKWGSKWDAVFDGPLVAAAAHEDAAPENPAGFSDEGGELLYEFLTAYSPPEPFLAAASRLFPQLVFELTYAEPGWDVAGRIRAKGGKVTRKRLTVDEVLEPHEQWY